MIATRDHGWKFVVIAFAVLTAVGVALVFLLPGPNAVYQMYWSQESIRRLFYEDLGRSQAWSSFFAVVGSFIYGVAWLPLAWWTLRVTIGRFNYRQLVIAFMAWVFVYGHVPFLHAMLGSDACFNQRTGAPLKWYVERPTGEIILFDSPGYDTSSRAEKRPVTPDICTDFVRQRSIERPQKITSDIRDIEYFNPSSGRARIWYYKTPDGSFDLFDARGFHPTTSEPLRPVTKEIVSAIFARAAAVEAARKRAEEVETKKRLHAEQIEVGRKAELEQLQRQLEELASTRKNTDPTNLSSSFAPVQGPVTSSECPGVAQTQIVGSAIAVINGNLCQLRGTVVRGCAFWYDFDGKLLTRSCQGELPSYSDIYSVRGDPQVVVKITRCAPGAPGKQLDGCG